MTRSLSPLRIAFDGMGGDHGPAVTVAGAVDAVLQEPALTVLLVGDRAHLTAELAKHKYPVSQIEVHHAEEEVRMDDHPSVVVRQKRNSSLHVANRLVKNGEAQAVFTAGNTGAAMAISLLLLGRLPGVLRPALLVDFPSNAPSSKTSLIDVGANVDCKPLMLAQFAVMGEVYYRQVYGTPRPRVGLLSLGEEETKGNDQVHQTRDLLKHLKLNFIGNIEGQDIINGRIEVGVCDGFVGNALLKFGTGMAKVIVDSLKRETLSSGLLARLTAYLMFPILRKYFRSMDYAEQGFAPLLGVAGVSAIGHGKSSRKAIRNALLKVAKFSTLKTAEKIGAALQQNHLVAA